MTYRWNIQDLGCHMNITCVTNLHTSIEHGSIKNQEQEGEGGNKSKSMDMQVNPTKKNQSNNQAKIS